MLLTNLSSRDLHRAANLKERIDDLQEQLNALLGAAAATESAPPARKKRRMSAAGRARIRAAAKARWARIRGESGAAAAPAKKKRKMSAAGRARLAALAKERWRKAKAAGKGRL